MSIPAALLPTTCDIYRPFGAASPTTSNVPCRLVPDLHRGGAGAAATGALTWTHYLDVNETVDVRDGCTRTAGTDLLNYSDGDEVRIPTGAATPRFVVVFVEVVNLGTASGFKRAYLMRHAV